MYKKGTGSSPRMTFQYKMYHSKRKDRHLNAAIEAYCDVWNYCIALHRGYYRFTGKYLPLNNMLVHLTKVKKRSRYAHWNKLGSQAVQNVARRIDMGYQAYFRHIRHQEPGKASAPRFRNRQKYRSFTLYQKGYKLHDENHITVCGEDFKFVKHRPWQGTIKTVTVKRDELGDFWLCLCCEIDVRETSPCTGDAVGVSFEAQDFLVASDGRRWEPSPSCQKSLFKIKGAERKLARKLRGSGNRWRAKKELVRLWRTLRSQQTDYFFKTALELLAAGAPVVCVKEPEAAAPKEQRKRSGKAGRKACDAVPGRGVPGYSEFLKCVGWECWKHGVVLSRVESGTPVSTTCHICGKNSQPLEKAADKWVCTSCGAVLDRDRNTAENIRKLGLARLA